MRRDIFTLDEASVSFKQIVAFMFCYKVDGVRKELCASILQIHTKPKNMRLSIQRIKAKVCEFRYLLTRANILRKIREENILFSYCSTFCNR